MKNLLAIGGILFAFASTSVVASGLDKEEREEYIGCDDDLIFEPHLSEECIAPEPPEPVKPEEPPKPDPIVDTHKEFSVNHSICGEDTIASWRAGLSG